MGLIYLARCEVTRKCYVGCTIFSLKHRRRCHEFDASKGSKSVFHKALRKHGLENFTWSILKEDIHEDDLLVYEKFYIKKLGTKLPSGYNMTDGGEGMVGLPQWIRDAASAKVSQALKGRPKSIEHNQKVSRALTGKKLSKEHIESLKNANRPRLSDEQKRKIGLASKGKRRICKACGGLGHLMRTCPELTTERKRQFKRRKPSTLRGATYEEIYGAEKAEELKSKRQRKRISAKMRKMAEMLPGGFCL